MSFFDKPVVDSNAKASDYSVGRVKLIFCQKNGFISREEIPDYGADLDVELIDKESGASGRKFAVQIKSSGDFKLIKNNSFISFEFLTSRLGYLYRRVPAYGIVVLFDSKSEEIYFDYVEDIINRLTDKRDSEEWKNQDNVNIHVPVKNVLNVNQAEEIWTKVQNIYDNVESLIGDHGSKFDISQSDGNIFDFSDPDKIAKELEKHGTLLLGKYEYSLLNEMLGQITFSGISSSANLRFLAAVTYAEIGRQIDADYFLNKSLAYKSDYSNENYNILEFYKILNDFSLGRITNEIFEEKLQVLRKNVSNLYTLLSVDSNIFYSKVTALFNKDIMLDEEFEKELFIFFETIESADIEERQKYLLKVIHSNNIGGFGLKYFNKAVSTMKVRENIGLPINMNDRIVFAKKTLNLMQVPIRSCQEAYNYAKSNDDFILMAYSLFGASHNFLNFQFIAFSLGLDNSGLSILEEKKAYQSNLKYSLEAYNLFLKVELFLNAYKALYNASELKKIFRVINKEELNIISDEDLESRIQAICRELNIVPFKSNVDALSSDLENMPDDWSLVKDGEEHSFARFFADSCGLPEDRIENIVLDIKAAKIFEQNCKNPDIKLLQDLSHTKSLETYYAEPPIFILKNEKTGSFSSRSNDIYKLLKEFEELCREK